MILSIRTNQNLHRPIARCISTGSVKIYAKDDKSKSMLPRELSGQTQVIIAFDNEDDCLGINVWHDKIELLTLPGSTHELSELELLIFKYNEINIVLNTIIDIIKGYKNNLIPEISIDSLIFDLYDALPYLELLTTRYRNKGIPSGSSS